MALLLIPPLPHCVAQIKVSLSRILVLTSQISSRNNALDVANGYAALPVVVVVELSMVDI